MMMFLFYVNTIVGLDEWTDRKLIFEIAKFSESDGKLFLDVTTDEPVSFRKLSPKKNYAIQFEPEIGEKEIKYYSLRAFEIMPPLGNETTYLVILHIDKIEIDSSI